MPIDPPSGGSWIGANDIGLVACLLNANPHQASGAQAQWLLRSSRGTIVPSILAAETIDDALVLARNIDATMFPPFRLIVLNTDSYFIASSTGASLSFTDSMPLRTPLLLTSSGLGDHLVERLRRALFEELFSSEADPLVAQRCFHEHHWHDRPHLSVAMTRPDARTVCRTVIDLRSDSVLLSHSSLDDRLDADGPHSLEMQYPRRIEVAA